MIIELRMKELFSRKKSKAERIEAAHNKPKTKQGWKSGCIARDARHSLTRYDVRLKALCGMRIDAIRRCYGIEAAKYVARCERVNDALHVARVDRENAGKAMA